MSSGRPRRLEVQRLVRRDVEPPQRRADLQRFAPGTVGPESEAATDPALVVPRDDLPYLHLPVTGDKTGNVSSAKSIEEIQ